MCLSPIYKRGKLSDRSDSMFVPCGYCSECVRRKKLDWQIRLDAALAWSDCAFFRLLTYDPEHYDFDIYDKEIIKDHIQRFVKRLRRRIEYHFGKSVKLKYFIASEYGETYDRLHYHALFFIKGAKFTWLEMKSIINTCWPYGIVGNTFNVNSGRIAYCVKYIQKQYNVKFYSRYPMRQCAPRVERDFRVGRRQSVYDFDQLPYYMLNGKKVTLPYYWLKTLLSDTERISYRSTIHNYMVAIREIPYIKEVYNRLARQNNFEMENAVGYKYKEYKHLDNSDLLPNLVFYESNI